MKQIFINELNLGDIFTSEYFGLSDLKKGTDKMGRPYWDLTLVDNSGQMKAKVWSDLLVKLGKSADKFSAGDVLLCSGQVQEFRGVLQFSMTDLVLPSAAQLESDVDMADIFPSSQFSANELEKKYLAEIATMQEPFLKQLLTDFFEEFKALILIAPAAKFNHHNFRGGLAEHVVEMMHLANTIAKDYPEVNRDLVLAGIFFHDIGKLQELEFNSFAINYTTKGKLLGHISIGNMLVEKYVEKHYPKLDAPQTDLLVQLEHIILSHHGKLEYGSPVLPKTMEAIVVSRIDELSSKAQFYKRVLHENQNTEAEFTNFINGLDTEVYLHKQAQNSNSALTYRGKMDDSTSPKTAETQKSLL